MPFDHLTGLLPDGAVLTEITRPDGQPATNIKAAYWQGAVPLSGDADEDEDAILTLAWSLQGRYEHHLRVEAANKAYQAQLDTLGNEAHADMATKIEKAKDDLKAKKAQGTG